MLLSATKCPYDETECEERVKALDAFKKSVEYMAKNHINQTFHTTAVACCPRNNPETCIRYQRYMNIVNRMKNNGK